MELTYITEENAKRLVESEVEANKDKGFVISPTGFAKHLNDTGNIAYRVSLKIIQNHPTLAKLIHPEINRVEGWMHDFTKIYEGDQYHEVGTAHLIMTKGDSDLGLVTGGTKTEQKQVLKHMASLFASDYSLYEELGKDPFPQNALYPKKAAAFTERLSELRHELSDMGPMLTREQFALPYSLDQQICLYADLTNIGGKIIPAEERLAEMSARYNDPNCKYFNPTNSELTLTISPRILSVCNTIEYLLK